MRDLLPRLVWLIPALPLAAALGIGLRLLLRELSGDAAEAFTARLAQAAALAALLGLVVLDALALAGRPLAPAAAGEWFAAGGLVLPVGFTLDRLALSIATLWALLGWLALVFSARYMHRESGFHRFFLALSLFVGSMLLLVLAGSAILAFAAWELAGLASWLLIGYARERPTATGNAVRAYITNRIGDAAFLMSLGFCALWTGRLDWAGVFDGASRLGTVPAGLLAFGFVVAAAVKSAQLPFSPWIARALEGPTPSSAIFYGSLLVHAGVYLLLRAEPLLRNAPELMVIVAAIGTATAIYAWLCSLVQSDVKSGLMFATLAQVGLMFVAIGLGWFTLAAWHLALHASWRAWQFLAAPSYLELGKTPVRPVAGWLGRRQALYGAALQRFWLETVGDALLTAATRRLARDVDAIDQRIVQPALGLPMGAMNAIDGDPLAPRTGLAGHLLAAVADRLDRFERHLLVQVSDGRLAHGLKRIGHALSSIEQLLEQPRYLFLFIMATLVVIL